MTQVLLVTEAQINKVEKSFNNKLGRYFKVNNITEDVDGNIDTVEVDLSQFMRDDATGKYIINGDKVKRLYQNLTTAQQTAIDNAFGVDIVSWYNANKVDFSTITISGGTGI